MKKHTLVKLFLITIIIILSNIVSVNAQFTNGNLVVLKIGNGTDSLANWGNQVYVQEYTPTGTLVNTIAVPSTGTSPFCISGSALSEGMLARTPDGKSVCFAGYKVAPPLVGGVANSLSSAVNRVVYKINYTGTISAVATTSVAFSANNIRAAVTDGTTNYWAVGGNSGVFRMGATSTDTATVTLTSTNIKYIGIFNNQLYYTTSKGANDGLYKVGNGTPTSFGQTSTNMIPTGSGSSPCGFSFNPTSTICYIADEREIAIGGGIQKWINNAGTWSLAYTLGSGPGLINGCKGIEIDWNATNPIIYAITADTINNRIIKIVDNGSNAIATILATAANKIMFKGIAFAPYNVVPVAPTVSTLSKTGITLNSVICSGNLLSNGNSAITAMGICYGNSLNPDITGQHTTISTTFGVFNNYITPLSPGITYHYRAYAQNAVGITYGADSTFTTYTTAVAPVLITNNYSNITATSADISSDVLNDGGSTITARGVCWNTTNNPTLSNNFTSETGTVGAFTSNITGLNQGITYHIRAYATNSIGTSYGNEITLTVPYFIPAYTINQIKNVNAQGVADSLNVNCSLTAVVHGINYTAAGLSFYIMDINGGINVYSPSATYGYAVKEGDKIRVIGKIGQTRGLIQILPDSIVKISSANTLNIPEIITALSESYESILVEIDGLTYVSGWPVIAGPTASVILQKGTTPINVKIFSQCSLQGTAAPTGVFNLIGIESQYASTATPPYNDGYFIYPRFKADIVSVNELQKDIKKISVYPNPSNGKFNIISNTKNKVDIDVYTIQGSLIHHTTTNEFNTTIDLSAFEKGLYLIKITDIKTNTIYTEKLVFE